MIALVALLAALAGSSAASAAPLAVGATLPEIALADQHDVAVRVGPETRLLLFTRDMDASKLTKEVLADHGVVRRVEYVTSAEGLRAVLAEAARSG